MKYELEISYIVDDVQEIAKMLELMGYKHVGKEYQRNIYMYHPFFPDMINKMKYFRFRFCYNEDGMQKGEISFSYPHVELLNGKPMEIRPSFGRKSPFTPDEMDANKKFVEELGWKEGIILLKKRDYFSMEDDIIETKIHFEVDHDIVIQNKMDNIPDVNLEPTVQISIETMNELMDKKSLMEMLNETASKIGLPRENMVMANYFGRYLDKVRNGVFLAT